MRLHTFISENIEPILQGWIDFASQAWPAASSNIPDLRDHAHKMLLAIINDMQTTRSEVERHDKPVGNDGLSAPSDRIGSISAMHAKDRLASGYDVRALVAEYRALRASVLHLWSRASPDMDATQIQDMTRFNECVDQLLAESVISHSESVEHSRKLLLAILGHDLRTPLSAVSLMVDLLEENENLSAPGRQMTSTIMVAAREMKCLVADLLDFSGSHLGVKMHLTRQSMNLEDLCREVIEEIRAAHPSCVFELETNGVGDGEWDRPRLRQVISNLLANSVRHGSAETPIRLFIKEGGHAVVLGVCNQGPPIPPTLQTVMFDPLRRCSSNGSARDLGGFGLGLYIAREIALAHGGAIEVSSDDRETAFIVKLPRKDLFQNK